MSADLDTVKVGLEIVSIVATGAVAFLGLKIRNVTNTIMLKQAENKEAMVANQTEVKEELIAAQTKVKEELTQAMSGQKLELAVHTAQDDLRFKSIEFTLGRIDKNVEDLKSART